MGAAMSVLWLVAIIVQVYVGFLALMITFPWLQAPLVYLQWIRFPLGNLDRPEVYGFRHGEVHSIRIKTKDDVSLGAWHINPLATFEDIELSSGSPLTRIERTEEITPSTRVYLYLHGNAGTRAQHTRIAFYQALRSVDRHAHVLALDYRGFGDSDGWWVTEETIMTDAMAGWDYLVKDKRVAPKNIIVVGHSLGTGVATQLVGILQRERNVAPRGVLLIAPYTSIPDAALEYPAIPLLMVFKHHPALADFARSFVSEKLNSTQHIGDVKTPVLMLHGAADTTIPVHHAHRLFTALVAHRAEQHVGRTLVVSEMNAVAKPFMQTTGIGGEAFLVKGDEKVVGKSNWLVEVLWAQHNNVHWYAVARDALKAWVDEISTDRAPSP